MKTNSKHEVAVEFGYASSVVSLALTKQDFSCAGDLIDYLELYEEDLHKEDMEKNAKESGADHEKILTLREETELLYRSALCLRCRKRPRTIIILPCGHFSLCSNCEKWCRYCPVLDCNSYIMSAITTFMV